jgi:hypothetical protein
MELAAGERLITRETVAGESPRWSASILRLTGWWLLRAVFPTVLFARALLRGMGASVAQQHADGNDGVALLAWTGLSVCVTSTARFHLSHLSSIEHSTHKTAVWSLSSGKRGLFDSGRLDMRP